MRRIDGLAGAVILSTCNRVELCGQPVPSAHSIRCKRSVTEQG
jgi:glutamyl-tRNA reductase